MVFIQAFDNTIFSVLRHNQSVPPFWRGSVTLDPTNPEHHRLLWNKNVCFQPYREFHHCQRGQLSSKRSRSIDVGYFYQDSQYSCACSSLGRGANIDAYLDHDDDDHHDRQLIQALWNLSDPENVTHPTDFFVRSNFRRTMERDGVGKGRMMLIGDAAHAMRATSGQEGSMALEDAVVLCRALQRLLLLSSTEPGIGINIY
jgi:2-polyprenyl-6-methoxyphenol hydroxylase-like FAD-dependent oxidoreductase